MTKPQAKCSHLLGGLVARSRLLLQQQEHARRIVRAPQPEVGLLHHVGGILRSGHARDVVGLWGDVPEPQLVELGYKGRDDVLLRSGLGAEVPVARNDNRSFSASAR